MGPGGGGGGSWSPGASKGSGIDRHWVVGMGPLSGHCLCEQTKHWVVGTVYVTVVASTTCGGAAGEYGEAGHVAAL